MVRGWSGLGDISSTSMSFIADDPRAGTSSIDISESSPRPSALRLGDAMSCRCVERFRRVKQNVNYAGCSTAAFRDFAMSSLASMVWLVAHSAFRVVDEGRGVRVTELR